MWPRYMSSPGHDGLKIRMCDHYHWNPYTGFYVERGYLLFIIYPPVGTYASIGSGCPADVKLYLKSSPTDFSCLRWWRGFVFYVWQSKVSFPVYDTVAPLMSFVMLTLNPVPNVWLYMSDITLPPQSTTLLLDLHAIKILKGGCQI